MSHYQDRLEQDLAKVRGEIADIGRAVETAIRDAVHALLTGNRELAASTALGDHAINRRVRRLDHDCHAFVARHLPSAGHLRFVSSALRLSLGLERIGDYAVAVARETVQLSDGIPPRVARDIELLASQAEAALHQALKAWNEANAELARGTTGMAEQVNVTAHKVFDDLLEEGRQGEGSVRDLFALLGVFHRLSRVSDQAKNICEETLFTVAGETKPPKVYRVLFVDRRDDTVTQLAVAYARKAFPGSGRYASAGLEPSEELDPRCAAFLDRHGYDVAGLAPSTFDATHEELAAHHVIVSFVGDLRPHVPRLPFATTVLEWQAEPLPGGLDQERTTALLEEVHREIAARVRELMETLRGEEAN